MAGGLAVEPANYRARVMRRRLVHLGQGALLGLLTVVVTTSCSPAPEQVLAVEAVNGTSARFLTMTCKQFSPNTFGVYRSDVDDDEPLQKWAVSRDFTGPVVTSVRAFHQPQGWSTYRSGISAFKQDGTYTASVRGAVNAKGISGRVTFSVAQLRELSADEVLTADSDGEAETMSREDFLSQANGLCADLAS